MPTMTNNPRPTFRATVRKACKRTQYGITIDTSHKLLVCDTYSDAMSEASKFFASHLPEDILAVELVRI